MCILKIYYQIYEYFHAKTLKYVLWGLIDSGLALDEIMTMCRKVYNFTWTNANQNHWWIITLQGASFTNIY